MEKGDYIKGLTNIINIMRREWKDQNRYADPDPDRFQTGAGWHRFVLNIRDLYKGPVTL